MMQNQMKSIENNQKNIYKNNFYKKESESYKHKYLCLINKKNMEILSNLSECDFFTVLLELTKKINKLKNFKIVDCIDFEYSGEDAGITLADLYKYL